MAEVKRSKRVAFRNTVYYGPKNPPEHVSFITDLSETGLCIQTSRVFQPGTRLYMIIEVASRRFEAEGVVVLRAIRSPLITWIWIGAVVVLFGTVYALSPQPKPSPARRREVALP